MIIYTRMKPIKRLVGLGIVFALLLVVVKGERVEAQGSTRLMTIQVEYTQYSWWMINYANNQIVCQVFVDHEGIPTLREAIEDCGYAQAAIWWNTPTCKEQITSDCVGVYMFLASVQPAERDVVIELPPVEVWVSLEGCNPTPPTNLCQTMPVLVLTGKEPIPEQYITGIHGTYDGVPFSCPDTDTCKIPLHTTSLQGSTIEFWADSSYGDTSERFTAQVRVVDTGVLPQPGSGGWYVDIISSQWQGPSLASCTRIWEAFPPVGNPPGWLSTPDNFELLASDQPYYYLAGRLISQGLVDVSSCQTGGLLPNGYADVCGLEKANPIMANWQNQFDQQIIEIAKETGVPAQLMKNLFAQESQFWPGVFRVPFEYGLGQITDQGTDTILLWNTSFFTQFCPLVLSQEACDRGYLGLSPADQEVLRGALALQAKSDCPDCPTGIDLSNVHFTVSLFANTLLANCAQVSRSVYTASEMMAGRIASYEDLWRLTIANYHAGPGCVSYAIHQAWQTTGTLNWEEVKTQFTPPCKGVVPYVDQITKPDLAAMLTTSVSDPDIPPTLP